MAEEPETKETEITGQKRNLARKRARTAALPGNPGLKWGFVGPNGIRAGWRFLMFAAIIVGLLYGKRSLYGMLHVHVPSPGDKVIFPGHDGADAAINFTRSSSPRSSCRSSSMPRTCFSLAFSKSFSCVATRNIR
jgi:hypothetical protein